MMIAETAGLFIGLASLALIGLGPAAWLLPQKDRSVWPTLGVAPALGMALAGIIGFPLVRYLGPVETWAWPVTLALIVASAALFWWVWKQPAADPAKMPSSARPWALATVVVATYAILVLPLLTKDVQYTVFRTNPSDAFVNITVAESVRVVPWQTILEGGALVETNLENVRILAESSPTALFSARLIELPLHPANRVTFAWTSILAGFPTYRFYYAFHLLPFAVAVPLILVMSRQLKLPWILWSFSAGAVAAGFWARFILESDSGGQAVSVPIFLLVVFAWGEAAEHPPGLLTRRNLLLAIAGAALVCYYAELLPFVVLAFGLYAGLGMLQGTMGRKQWLGYLASGLMVVLILVLTGQADWYIRLVVRFFRIDDQAFPFRPNVWQLLIRDGVSAFWGLAPTVTLSRLPGLAAVPLRTLFDGISLVLTLGIGAAAAFAVRRGTAPTERVMTASAVAALGLMAIFAVRNSDYAAGRVVTYCYPFLILGALIGLHHASLYLPQWQSRATVGLASAWLIIQLGLGAYLPTVGFPRQTFTSAPADKAERFDVTPITTYLARVQPRSLVVSVPRGESWAFALYAMSAFGQFGAHFQSGLVIDNNVAYRNMWLSPLTALPDFAVVAKRDDYVGAANLGEKVAETEELVLYRVTTTDLAPFQQHEQRLQAEDALKLPFPTLQLN